VALEVTVLQKNLRLHGVALRRKKNPGNHIVGFLKNLFVNYGGK